MSEPAPDLKVSIVAPLFNEEGNIEALTAEIIAAFGPKDDYEIVLVDDASQDATAALVKAMASKDRRIRLIQHDKQSGQSFAVANGVRAARAPWVATLDGDRQNDPADLVDMLRIARAAPTPPLVNGWRQKRNDPTSRVIATRLANSIRASILGDDCPDTACGMKVFRREDYLRLPVFNGLHRFTPALMQAYGVPLIVHPVNHRARTAGVSKYTNWKRGLVSIRDLMGVMWLKSRIRHPLATDITPPPAPVKAPAAKTTVAKTPAAKKPVAKKLAK
jgi:dolichol-phosphate mannosyltransferase